MLVSRLPQDTETQGRSSLVIPNHAPLMRAHDPEKPETVMVNRWNNAVIIREAAAHPVRR